MLGPDLMVIAADAVADAVTEISVHTAGTDIYSDTAESAAARATTGFTVGVDGDLTIPLVTFTGGEADGPATRIAYRNSVGDIVGGLLLPEGTVFSGAGSLEVLNILEDAVSS